MVYGGNIIIIIIILKHTYFQRAQAQPDKRGGDWLPCKYDDVK